MKKFVCALLAAMLLAGVSACAAEEADKVEVGIIGAMTEEVDGLVALLEDVREYSAAACTFYRGTVDGHPVVVAKSGMGKVYAAMCAQTMILQYAPEAIINIGVGGAVSEALNVGDVVIPTCEVQHDYDIRALGFELGTIYDCNIANFPCDENIMELIAQACEQENLHTMRGVSASGDQFVEGMEKKQWLTDTFDAIVCEMEGGAIAQVCHSNNVAYAAYRFISDTAEGSEYAANMKDVAQKSAELAYEFLKLYFAE